jgi:hypothetical protein
MASFLMVRKWFSTCGLHGGFFQVVKKKVQKAFFFKKSVQKHSWRFFGFSELCQNRSRNERNLQIARAKAGRTK